MDNIQLLISLGINDQQSRRNINQYIEKLKTENLDVTLNVKGNPQNSKAFTQMEKQIEELQAKIKQLDNQLSNIGKGQSSSKSSGVTGRIITDIKQAQQEIKNFLKNDKGFQNFDFKLSVDTSSGQQILKGFTANVRDVNNEIKKLSFDGWNNQLKDATKDSTLKSFDNSLKSVSKTLEDARNKAELTTKQFKDFKKQVEVIHNSDFEPNKSGAFDKLNNEIKQFINSSSQLKKVNKDIGDLHSAIEKNGALSSQRLNELGKSIRNINSNTSFTIDQKVAKLRNELNLLNNEFSQAKHTQKMAEGMKQAERSVKDLESSLLKMLNTYKRQTQGMDLSRWKNEINALSRIPNFTSQTDIKNFNDRIKTARTSLNDLNAKIQESSRNSMTFMDQMKIALERFPIEGIQVGAKLFELLETP
ncbi:hypothetical protein M3649_04255 [Ureibacillus chungkukjangi]|uniref:hypothetical protein n=1 Tax=Ureibacillus chungkukjangi TaxID=1202712 RepID=UPI00203CA21D|nr:hypothetical protein [Ureibacillus chungkukjangi]MCM3387346.1 hypothetical protein [Ureibacillus chungkukjangi]